MFRCDSPERQRLYEMTITAQAGEVVQFETQPLWTQKRSPQSLLARYAPRAVDLLRICGWCLRVEVGSGTWEDIEKAVNRLHIFERVEYPRLIHEMCDECYRAVTELVARA